MSEFEGSGSSAGDASSESSATTDATSIGSGESAASSESLDGGYAPTAGDSAVGPAGSQSAVPAGFAFAGRQFRDLKHAEEYFRSQVGRVPETQRQIALQAREMQQMHARMEALQNALAQQTGGQVGQDQQASPESGFADELAQSGDLQFIAELAEEKGLAHAIYALADRFDKRQQEQLGALADQIVQERLFPIERRAEFTDRMNSTMGAVRQLAQMYPELDEHNQSPEAQEAQQEILEIWKSFPPEWALEDPARTLRIAVQEYRENHGTPAFALTPGTSGSPSARAAMAAEAAYGAPTPIDGAPGSRQRPGQPPPRNSEEAFEREILGADDNYARSQTGSVLWKRVS